MKKLNQRGDVLNVLGIALAALGGLFTISTVTFPGKVTNLNASNVTNLNVINPGQVSVYRTPIATATPSITPTPTPTI